MKPRLLVVDDEPEFVQLAQYNLSQDGYEVFTASNGVEALDQARRVLPDLILLDLMLPDIDGASVCEILQTQPSTADVPVIVISSLDTSVARDRSSEAGAVAHLRKPVEHAALRDCIQATLERQRSAEAEESVD